MAAAICLTEYTARKGHRVLAEHALAARNEVTFGRDAGSDIVLPAEPTISRRQGCLRVDGDEAAVENEGRNPLRVRTRDRLDEHVLRAGSWHIDGHVAIRLPGERSIYYLVLALPRRVAGTDDRLTVADPPPAPKDFEFDVHHRLLLAALFEPALAWPPHPPVRPAWYRHEWPAVATRLDVPVGTARKRYRGAAGLAESVGGPAADGTAVTEQLARWLIDNALLGPADLALLEDDVSRRAALA